MPKVGGDVDQRRAIARRIKAERLRVGLSMSDVGRAIKCSRQNYMKMERGDNRIRAEMLPALAAAFGIDTKWFLHDRPASDGD